ncbi:MAG: ATP-binding cassette domain-containing protein, partial [Candidatus Omnitrophica bacterium]|nr:ATP-binding cassette domain-containing protein [Candidatus Omnitrophota bacterium]
MIRLHEITKSFGKHLILDKGSLQIEPEMRLGLIGRNGSGKSTLFKIISGEEGLDSGEIISPKNYQISHLSQHLKFNVPTVLEVGCQGLRSEEKYDHYKVEEILFGLGFSKEDLTKDPHELSGGFQVLLSLAKALVSKPNLLLLDEPTNYLDIVAIRWITRFIRSWKNEMIIISHDQSFLDNVTTHTAIIHRQNILRVKGSTAKLAKVIDEFEEHYEKQRISEEKQRRQLQTFIDKNIANPATATQAKSRRRMLEKIPERQKLETLYDLSFDFQAADFPGKTMLEITNLGFYYEPKQELIKNLSCFVETNDR